MPPPLLAILLYFSLSLPSVSTATPPLTGLDHLRVELDGSEILVRLAAHENDTFFGHHSAVAFCNGATENRAARRACHASVSGAVRSMADHYARGRGEGAGGPGGAGGLGGSGVDARAAAGTAAGVAAGVAAGTVADRHAWRSAWSMPDQGRVWFHDILPMEQALIASALESAGLRAITADELVYDARVGVHVPRDGWDLLWSRHSAFDHDKDLKVLVLAQSTKQVLNKPGRHLVHVLAGLCGVGCAVGCTRVS